jgi:hypothetical protein
MGGQSLLSLPGTVEKNFSFSTSNVIISQSVRSNVVKVEMAKKFKKIHLGFLS